MKKLLSNKRKKRSQAMTPDSVIYHLLASREGALLSTRLPSRKRQAREERQAFPGPKEKARKGTMLGKEIVLHEHVVLACL
jgi:hypothetical protein